MSNIICSETTFKAIDSATKFTSAITRLPASSAVNGLRKNNTGCVIVDVMVEQHADYTKALRQAGVGVTELPALEQFPDGQFVEDTALCLPGLAVMMRPMAKSRRGEVSHMRDVLSNMFDKITDITDGFIEAGDILTTHSEVMVGLSERTDMAGVGQLNTILSEHGFKMRVMKTPCDVLHLKTDCSLLDHNCILSTERLASTGCFEGYELLIVPAGEELAANLIRVNDHVIMPSGFSKTESMLHDRGLKLLVVGNSECAKIDGGMSCLSLRY